MRKRQWLVQVVIWILILSVNGLCEEENQSGSYIPTDEDIAKIVQETYGWSSLDYQKEIIILEHQLLDYEVRLLEFDKTVKKLNLLVESNERVLDLQKKMYQMKVARAVLIGGGVGVGVTVVAIILVRLAYAGKI